MPRTKNIHPLHDIIDILHEDATEDNSYFVKLVQETNELSQSLPFLVVKVTDEIIDELERYNNICHDWSQIYVHPDVNVNTVHHIRNNIFSGRVVLNGNFEKKVSVSRLDPTTTRTCGVYNSYINNCIIDGQSLISNCNLVKNVRVCDNAVLIGCGEVIGKPKHNFGNGRELPLGLEVGGRTTKIYAEMPLQRAIDVAQDRKNHEMLKDYNTAVSCYVERITCDYTIISSYAKVLNTPNVVDVFLGPWGSIDGAAHVINSTILSTEAEKTFVSGSSMVCNSLLQWGTSVETSAIVEASIVCEHSHVERHGMLTDSVLGPNSGVAEGECTASLCGPFVGFHHQALLIAAMWPKGKGNVGYGANVGSNHTSKAPDQDIWCGEGVFYGLGTVIKLPTNMQESPYSVVASGLTTLPQKVSFPFSLINTPSVNLPTVSPAFNELVPAWVLTDNIYAILRNEIKYKKRDKSRRTHIDIGILGRMDICDMMINARKKLKSVEGTLNSALAGKNLAVWVESQIDGIGKNYMTESSRLKGIASYTKYIRFYAVGAWYHKLLESNVDQDGERKLEISLEFDNLVMTKIKSGCDICDYSGQQWPHVYNILKQEYGQSLTPSFLLNEHERNMKELADDVYSAKEKDDHRGRRIIDDYDYSHTSAENDSFVKETRAMVAKSLQEIGHIRKSCGVQSSK